MKWIALWSGVLLEGSSKLISKWPDLVTTFLGVASGGVIAWKIAQWQLAKQEKAEDEKNQEYMSAMLEQVEMELRDNQWICKQITTVLSDTKNTRLDVMHWVRTISDALSDTAFRNLVKSGLQRILPEDIYKDIYQSYQMTTGLSNMVRQSQAKIDYLFGYYGDQKAANSEFQKIATHAVTVESHLDWVKNNVYAYAEELKDTIINSD